MNFPLLSQVPPPSLDLINFLFCNQDTFTGSCKETHWGGGVLCPQPQPPRLSGPARPSMIADREADLGMIHGVYSGISFHS